MQTTKETEKRKQRTDEEVENRRISISYRQIQNGTKKTLRKVKSQDNGSSMK
jgi:hypothetical protein